MENDLNAWEHLEKLIWTDVLLIAIVFTLAQVLIFFVQRLLRRIAESAAPDRRLTILRALPIARLLIHFASVAIVIPILVPPTFGNIMALSAGLGLALAYTLKDYGTSFTAGLVTVFERPYQPGDWIEIDGKYGEVKSISSRAIHLLTVDDRDVYIPHSRVWLTSLLNATSGRHSMLCVSNFYLHPDHDARAARLGLMEIAAASSYRAPESPVSVIVLEKPWGTHYRVKAYVRESRDQFLLITDVTVRGKEMLRQMKIRFAQAPYAEMGAD